MVKSACVENDFPLRVLPSFSSVYGRGTLTLLELIFTFNFFILIVEMFDDKITEQVPEKIRIQYSKKETRYV